MRVMVIGHTYVVPENRGKLAFLANRPDLELSLLTPSHWVDDDLGLQASTEETRFEHILLPIHGGGNVRRYRYPFGKLFYAIQRFRPHIVHLDSEASSFSAMQVCLLKKIIFFYLSLFVWDNIVTTRFRHLRLARWVYANTDHLIAGSDDALSTARAQGFKGEGAVLPQLGIDLKDYSEIRNSDPWKKKKGFRVGYIGRIAKRKGLEILFSAIKKVPDALLIIVGDGQERTRLEQKANQLGLADRIFWAGKVSHSQIPFWLNSFDALVLPSITTPGWKEQFGHVLIEAMAANVPVIGSCCGVIPDVIGDSGLLFQEGNSAKLAEKITQLITDTPLRNQLIKKAMLRVEEQYSNKAIADRTYDIWKRMVPGI